MAKITATFEQRVTRDGHCVGVTISDYDNTDPVSLEKCLLVSLSGASKLVRAATLLDMYSYSTPSNYGIHNATIYGVFNSLHEGDIVNFNTLPEYWELTESLFTLSLAVTSESYAPSLGSVRLDTASLVHSEFACGFDGVLNISVTRGSDTIVESDNYPVIIGMYPDGAALPTYNSVVQTYHPVKRSVTIFSTATEALNKIESVKAELQSLVTESNTLGTDFESITVEVFE